MSNKHEQEKIFKSWAGIREVTLIKEVATKGEHIQLCILYGARKRRMSTDEYTLLFHDIVQTYVNRLLNERLVCKAETVLRNVQRNVMYFFYEFASDCNDPELRELITEHLKKKDPEFKHQERELLFYNKFLQKIKRSEDIKSKAKKYLKRLNLEFLFTLDSATKQSLLIEMYFETRDGILLKRINKYVMWEFLIKNKQVDEIIQWCEIQHSQRKELHTEEQSDLKSKYYVWSLEPTMYKNAVRILHNIKNEILRNCFAAAGYIFPDESCTTEAVIRRLCLTNSLQCNQATIETLNLGRYLFETGLHYLLLKDIVTCRQLEELIEENPEEYELLRLLVDLKTRPLTTLDGFEKISFHTTKYVQRINGNNVEECILPIFFEFLINQPSTSKLQCATGSGPLNDIAYIRLMQQQLLYQNDSNITKINHTPSVHDLLKSFKRIDFKRLSKETCSYGKVTREKSHHENVKSHYHLNFIQYIKQSRSAYAVYILLLEQLGNYAQITRTHLFSACESVYNLTLQTRIEDSEVVCHSIAFCEMLGFDTQKLRCALKVKQYLTKHNVTWSCHNKSHISVIQEMERLLVQRLKDDLSTEGTLPFEEYTAIMVVMAISLNTSCTDKDLLVMKHYAATDHYWRLLVLLLYFNVPLEHLKCVVKHFGSPTIGGHLLRALSFDMVFSEETCSGRRSQTTSKRHLKSRGLKKGEKRTAHTSTETITSTMVSCKDASTLIEALQTKNSKPLIDKCIEEPDIFALILVNTSTGVDNQYYVDINSFLDSMQFRPTEIKQSTVVNFLHKAVEQNLSIMAVLAASLSECNNLNLGCCWLVWLVVTTNQWPTLLRLTVENRMQDFPWILMDHLISLGQIRAIVRSFEIFYPDNALVHLFRFLYMSTQNSFVDDTIHELRLYCLAWSNDEIRLPLNQWINGEKVMKSTIRLLLVHVQHNFESVSKQLKFLTSVCKSGLSDLAGQIDFCLLRQFCEILQLAGSTTTQSFPFNYIHLLQQDHGDVKEYERLLEHLLVSKEYDVAVLLASLLQKPIGGFIYLKWVSELETLLAVSYPEKFDNYEFPFKQYEEEVFTHSLPPETLVNFLLFAASNIPLNAYKSRYYILQKALNVIKHHHLFPNESFDRDQIEYDMIFNYLAFTEESDSDSKIINLYYSEYFEEIMVPERHVLYKSYVELKELAGLEDFNICDKIVLSESQSKRLESLLNRIIDEGDIVEALRLQELFDVRPLDLRYLVFCMALAESMSSVYSLSDEERHLLSEVERSSFSKFTKRTLCAGPYGSRGDNLSDSSSTLEFEEIPSKEKQETLTVLQGIGSKLKYGVNFAKRIISCYRAAMYLDKEYLDVLRTKDVQVLLQSVAEESCLHRLLVVSDIMMSTHMLPQEIAELLAYEITTAIVRPRFYILTPDQQAKHVFRNADLWGYNIDHDFHLFLELTPDRTRLGTSLLHYCDALKIYRKYQDDRQYIPNYYFEQFTHIIARYGIPCGENASELVPPSSTPLVLSHKKKNIIYVELLIKAHQAFVHDCSMEGIANVLKRAKVLNNILTQAKSWSLIVRMLTGIGRYREMYFCFDTLIKNEQFESLLGQFDEEKTIGLRQAILAYLREYCSPMQGTELFQLAALHFRMYKDLAELWEQEVSEILNKLYGSMRLADDSSSELIKFRCTPGVTEILQKSLEYAIHATENYLLDNKLLLAEKSATKAELIAMQIDLVKNALENPQHPSGYYLCFCVIQLKSSQIRNLIQNILSVSQSLIISRAYSFDIDWSEPLLCQYVIQMKGTYLKDFLGQVDITDDVIQNVVKGYQNFGQHHAITKQMDEHIFDLIEMVSSLTLKYKLASVLTLKSTILSLISNNSIHYLRDMKFGRREETCKS